MSWAKEARALAVPMLWVALCFAPTLGFDFVSWDDDLHVLDNPLVRAPASQSWVDHLTTPRLGYPTPMSVWTYRFEVALFGLDSALPFHASNVALHLVVCALAFLLGRRLGLSPAGAVAATLVFGLHPAVAEPVSWVSGRKDLLAGVFSLTSVLLGWSMPFDPGRPRSYFGPAAFLLALACKPVSAFVAPALFVLRVFAPLGGSTEDRAAGVIARARRALLEITPLLVLTAAVFPIAWVGQAATHSLREVAGPFAWLREIWYVLGFHLALAFGLRGPSVKHLPETWPPPFEAAVDLLPPVVFVLACGLAMLVRGPHRRVLVFGAAWAALAYLPSSSLIPLTRAIADVYLYMPLVGLGWGMGALLDEVVEVLAPVRRRWVSAAVIAEVGLALTLLVLPASAHWRNSATLWKNALERYPHDHRLCRNYGNARFDLDGAAAALRIYEGCARRYGAAPFEKNMAIALAELGELARARALFERVLARDPEDVETRRHLERIRREGRHRPREW